MSGKIPCEACEHFVGITFDGTHESNRLNSLRPGDAYRLDVEGRVVNAIWNSENRTYLPIIGVNCDTKKGIEEVRLVNDPSSSVGWRVELGYRCRQNAYAVDDE